jgi:iron complex outermembrane recepter protein
VFVASASFAALAAALPAAAQSAPPPPSGDTGQVAPGAGAATETQEVEGIVVTGLRRSLQQAIDIKRQADSIVDVVSAADIGKLPDKNIADSLQRVPGVNTVSAASGEGGFDENDRVSIRGTNPSLTQTLVDGHSIANGDWFILDQFQTVGRSVSYTLLPSEIVKNVVVYKSQQADLVEGGVSGSIDIVTRKPLDFTKAFTFEAQAQGEYSDLPGTWQPNLNALLAWKSPDGQFGLLAQGFYEKRDIRRDGVEVLGYAAVSKTDATGNALPNLVGVQYPTLIGASLFQQTREREGGSLTAQWRPSSQFEVSVTGFYSQLKADNTNSNFLAWTSKEIANNVPTAYTVRNNTLVNASFPLVAPRGSRAGPTRALWSTTSSARARRGRRATSTWTQPGGRSSG